MNFFVCLLSTVLIYIYYICNIYGRIWNESSTMYIYMLCSICKIYILFYSCVISFNIWNLPIISRCLPKTHVNAGNANAHTLKCDTRFNCDICQKRRNGWIHVIAGHASAHKLKCNTRINYDICQESNACLSLLLFPHFFTLGRHDIVFLFSLSDLFSVLYNVLYHLKIYSILFFFSQTIDGP